MHSRRESPRSVGASDPARHGDRLCGGGAGRARSRRRRQPPVACSLASSAPCSPRARVKPGAIAPLPSCALRRPPSRLFSRSGGVSLRCGASSLARPWARPRFERERPVPSVAALAALGFAALAPLTGRQGAKGVALCAFENEATPREEKRGRSRCCGSGTTAPFYFAAGESFGALAPLLRAPPAYRRLFIRHHKQEYYFAENKTKSTQQVASTQPPHHLAEAKQNQFYFV